jgi:type I restriction enzyme M protein
VNTRIRPNLFDDFTKAGRVSIYCEMEDLINEASVENFFVSRMLADLGIPDKSIKTKTSIQRLRLSRGSKKYNYRPDYMVFVKSKPVLAIDAKSPKENIDDYIEQCAHYSLVVNRKFEKKPLKYFLLTNGIKTGLYKWDSEKPILELSFEDFEYGNPRYEKLRNIISYSSLQRGEFEADDTDETTFILKKIDKEDAQKLFLTCHKYIWKAEKRSPSSAFMEFVKLIFLKLYHDRMLHEKYGVGDEKQLEVPKIAATFTGHWIEDREKDTINPINDLQFKSLLDKIEDDISRNNKKRIFDKGERIDLKPQTIKGVVKKLQGYDLFGIDEDLNGRLFETFLKATMRGKELGQYFTPRSIVLLASKLAKLEANHTRIERVLDACCGTGGFLIEALTEMRNKIRDNDSYSDRQKSELIRKLCDECLYGIDAATAPKLARIARINMYLHGDGGSHIYQCDGLDNEITIDKSEPRELQQEVEDLRQNIEKEDGFDVVLTNPPFSMWYETDNDEEERILKQYHLAVKERGTNKLKPRVRSMALFIERYHRLLKSGGRLLTIIDDTILSSAKYSDVRDFIRENFIIRANISLHGDAFRMSGARVKTALVYLEKKRSKEESQPNVFMYPSIRLGVDDLPVTSSKVRIEEARRKAEHEIDEICREYENHLSGNSKAWSVKPEKLRDRLDLKYVLGKSGRFVPTWQEEGYEIKRLSEIAKPIENIMVPQNIENKNKEFRILTISYEGRIRTEETRKGSDIGYKEMKIVNSGDLVFSEYNSFHGAIGFVMDEFNGALASGSYSVVRCENDYDALYTWLIMRTTELRAEMLISAIGVGRQTIDWADIKDIQLPMVVEEERRRLAARILDIWDAEKKAKESLQELYTTLDTKFGVESEQSKKWFEANKPPR